MSRQKPWWAREQLWLWCIFIVGCLVRLRQYFAHRSLWADEAMLALNIARRGFGKLTMPLSGEQAAPIGFLWAVKSATLLAGNTEIALRLVPLLAGIVTAGVGILWAWHFARGVARWVFALLICCSPTLISYSNEAKQYSVDAMFAMLLVYFASRAMTADLQRIARWLIALAITCWLGIWCSHPSCFVIGAACLSLLVTGLFERRRGLAWCALGIGIVSLVMLAINYRFFLAPITSDTYLADWWKDGYMPWTSVSSALKWVGRQLPLLMVNPGGFYFYSRAVPSGNWPVAMGCVPLVVVLIGICGQLIRGKRAIVSIVAMPILLVLAAAMLHKYPFFKRLLLFTLPLVYIAMAWGMGLLIGTVHRQMSWLRVALVCSLCALIGAYPVKETTKLIVQRQEKEELRDVLVQMNRQLQPGDAAYVTFGAHSAYEFYTQIAGLEPRVAVQVIQGTNCREKTAQLLQEARQITRFPRAWLITSHVYRSADGLEDQLILRDLKQQGVLRQQIVRTDAAAYLFEFQPR